MGSVLIVDDEPDICNMLSGILKDEGYDVFTARSCEEGERSFLENEPDVVLLDVWLPDGDGVEVLKKLKNKNSRSQFIMISGHSNIETAVRALKLGADDFLEKPLSIDKTLNSVKRALEVLQLREENLNLREKLEGEMKLIGVSAHINEVIKKMEIFAQSNSPILITGESGTGKEVVARTIHSKSPRSSMPFVPVNCAAIPEELIESELFGYEKGAFTGAVGRKKGKFDLAHRGTLFLDEIGDMSLKTQAKILRILQEQCFERVGGTDTIKVDVRIIAATNKNLEEEIKKERFRSDLYFRLKVLPIDLLPLRKRKEDIPVLVNHFIQYYCKIYRKAIKNLSSEALEVLLNYDWPGNVRELKNIVERLVIMGDDINIDKDDLPSEFQPQIVNDVVKLTGYDGTLEQARENFERDYIYNKLKQYDFNITRTAEVLEIARENLSRKIKQLGIKLKKE
jgi:two-component system nitrogen regulation response regulator NtrX